MKKLDFNRNIIGNALIWAAMMIAAALLMRGSDHAGMMILLMTVGWFTSNSFIDANPATSGARCAKRAAG